MSVEVIMAIGQYVILPICGVLGLWIFFHYVSK